MRTKSGLIIPDTVEVETHQRRVQPTERKYEGGSVFDDELQTEEAHKEELLKETVRLIDHINARPDHTVYVGSTDERQDMRAVFNDWRKRGFIGHNPNIRIDYGVPEGGIRIDA